MSDTEITDEDIKLFAKLNPDEDDEVEEPRNRPMVFATAEEMDAAIEKIDEALDKWRPAHSSAGLYATEVLAHMCAAIPKATGLGRDALIRRVRQHKDVEKSKRWDPYKKTPEELMVTIEFGLKDQRSTKSNWHRVLESAAEAKVERSIPAFKLWLREQEGIEGVISRGKSKPEAVAKRKAKIAEFSDQTAGYEPSSEETITLPEELVSGVSGQFIVVVFKPVLGSGSFVPVCVSDNESLIVHAFQCDASERRKYASDANAEARNFDRQFERKANHLWRRQLKTKGAQGYEKDEFVDERRDEITAAIRH